MRVFPKGLGWTIAVMIIPVAVMLAQHGSGKKHKDPPKPPPVDYDERWACKLGSYHNCSCQAMIGRVLNEWVEHCRTSTKDAKAYDACMLAQPKECDIIQKPDIVNPEHTCKRSCSKARCGCLDGPRCFGPSLAQPTDDQQDWEWR